MRAARQVLASLDTFVAFDTTLRRAAAVEGFTLAPAKLTR